MKSDAQKRADARYTAKAYEQIKIYSPREDRLRDLIAVAAERSGVSMGEYVRRAIWVQLQTDGIDASALDEMPPHGSRLNAADTGTGSGEDG